MERHRDQLGNNSVRRVGLMVGPTIFLATFFVWPVAQLLWRGLANDGGALLDTFRSPSIRAAAWFTLWQALVSTVLTLIVALPLAAVIANVKFRGRSLVQALVTVPFVLPTVVVAGAFLATGERLGATSGPFALTKSVFAIVIAHVLSLIHI